LLLVNCALVPFVVRRDGRTDGRTDGRILQLFTQFMAQLVAGVRRKALLVAAAVASYTSDDASHVLCLGLCVPEHQGNLLECASRTLFYVRTQR
jgi:hypothetical protein